GLLQGRLLRGPLADVAGDLGEPGELAAAVEHAGHDAVGLEAAPVLADAPPLRLVPPIPPRRRERALGEAGPPVLVGVEAREVLAEDLLCRVALDPLGAGVPARDVALR